MRRYAIVAVCLLAVVLQAKDKKPKPDFYQKDDPAVNTVWYNPAKISVTKVDKRDWAVYPYIGVKTGEKFLRLRVWVQDWNQVSLPVIASQILIVADGKEYPLDVTGTSQVPQCQWSCETIFDLRPNGLDDAVRAVAAAQDVYFSMMSNVGGRYSVRLTPAQITTFRRILDLYDGKLSLEDKGGANVQLGR